MAQHPLIAEIRNSQQWRTYRLGHQYAADRFIARVEADLPEQWKNFLTYKSLYKEGKLGGAMPIGDGRQTCVLPEVYSTWFVFSRPAGVPSKIWLRECIIKHPEVWLDDNAYDTTKGNKNL